VRTRTKAKARRKGAAAAEEPRSPGWSNRCKPTSTDDAEDKQRGGIQSLGVAFAILEEVARHRRASALRLKQARRPAQLDRVSFWVKTMVSLGYIRQEKTPSAIASAAPLLARRKLAR